MRARFYPGSRKDNNPASYMDLTLIAGARAYSSPPQKRNWQSAPIALGPYIVPFASQPERDAPPQDEAILSGYLTHSLQDNAHLCKKMSCTRSDFSPVSLSRTVKVSVYSPVFWSLTSRIWYRDSSGSEPLPR